MKNFEVNYEGNHIVAFNKLLFKTFSRNLFDPAYLQSKNLLIQSDLIREGRGLVKIFSFGGLEMVLRHYHRGGLPAKFINDHYLWQGLQKTRAICEANILAELHHKNMPVPQPVAALIHRKGIRYTADIITTCISEASTLREALLVKSLDEQVWDNIGNTIRKFHNHKCNHVDLNANNIMIDQQNKIYLIDFDRSRIEGSEGSWQKNNLKRLHRSLEKCLNNDVDFHYTSKDFVTLMQAYNSA